MGARFARLYVRVTPKRKLGTHTFSYKEALNRFFLLNKSCLEFNFTYNRRKKNSKTRKKIFVQKFFSKIFLSPKNFSTKKKKIFFVSIRNVEKRVLNLCSKVRGG